MSGEHRSRIARGAAAVVVLAGAVLGARVFTADPVQASPDLEHGFVVAINEARAEEGLGELAYDQGLTEAAREWTREMVAADALAHAEDITMGVPPGWTKAGENVGRGESVVGLMAAFIDSTGHRRNLLDPEFNHIGVGSIVNDAGVLYTTHRFAMAPEEGSAQSIAHSSDVECLDAGARIVVEVANDGAEPASIGAWVGYQAEQTAVIAAGSVASFVATNQPPGDARVRLFRDDAVIADEVVQVSC